MGGAVALLIHKKDPTYWHGAVLVAPMCKISEKVKPHPVVVSMLTKIEDIIPKWKIVPTKDVIDSAFKDPLKREEVRNNTLIYQDKPRLKTALEMLRISMSLEESLGEVALPFFVVHGEADTVTDPEVSKALYEQASSKDKTIKLYPGMWHALTSGESDDNIEIVFSDIIAWLDKRCAVAGDANGFAPRPITNRSGPVVEKFAVPLPSPTTKDRRKLKRVIPSPVHCLGGWKGRRMHYDSGM
ncbi:acylglycerol lipase [Sarracenia purpurea var. burkii]